jgi:hypothetical protein
VPAFVRRYPFCMARVTMNNSEQQNRLICIEKTFLADDGEKLFDAEGKPVEKWAPIERLLREYEADLDRTREMCAIIADYGLLEPFTMQATPANGQALNLAGMFRVRKRSSSTSTPPSTRTSSRRGSLGRIYAHLLSLENFGRLLSRKAKPAAQPAAMPRGEV